MSWRRKSTPGPPTTGVLGTSPYFPLPATGGGAAGAGFDDGATVGKPPVVDTDCLMHPPAKTAETTTNAKGAFGITR